MTSVRLLFGAKHLPGDGLTICAAGMHSARVLMDEVAHMSARSHVNLLLAVVEGSHAQAR